MLAILRQLVFSALVLMLLQSVVLAQTSEVTLENRVKAAYLYNILKFTQWKKLNVGVGSSSINICVLGEDGIARALEPVTQKTAQDRLISLEIITTLDEQKRCHVLVLSSNKHNKDVLAMAGNLGILTLSSHENFAVDGGMIGFVIRNGKVHLEVNVAVLTHAGVQLSSKVLQISTLVKSAGNHKR